MAKKASITQAKYDSEHCKRYNVKLNMENDSDIIEKLSSVPNIQGYIKQAIRKDISGSVPEAETWNTFIHKRIMDKLNKNGIIIRTQFNTDNLETIFEAFQDGYMIECKKYPGELSFKECFEHFTKETLKSI